MKCFGSQVTQGTTITSSSPMYPDPSISHSWNNCFSRSSVSLLFMFRWLRRWTHDWKGLEWEWRCPYFNRTWMHNVTRNGVTPFRCNICNAERGLWMQAYERSDWTPAHFMVAAVTFVKIGASRFPNETSWLMSRRRKNSHSALIT